MSFLLDTNICSAHMRRPGGLAHRFMQYDSRLAIPTIVLAELYVGVYRHPNPARLLFFNRRFVARGQSFRLRLRVCRTVWKTARSVVTTRHIR